MAHYSRSNELLICPKAPNETAEGFNFSSLAPLPLAALITEKMKSESSSLSMEVKRDCGCEDCARKTKKKATI